MTHQKLNNIYSHQIHRDGEGYCSNLHQKDSGNTRQQVHFCVSLTPGNASGACCSICSYQIRLPGSKIHQNALAAGGSPEHHWGRLLKISFPPLSIDGKEREKTTGKKGKQGERYGRKGSGKAHRNKLIITAFDG